MTKIEKEKIVRAAVGSARLEGYRGPPKVKPGKKAETPRAEAKPEVNDKR